VFPLPFSIICTLSVPEPLPSLSPYLFSLLFFFLFLNIFSYLVSSLFPLPFPLSVSLSFSRICSLYFPYISPSVPYRFPNLFPCLSSSLGPYLLSNAVLSLSQKETRGKKKETEKERKMSSHAGAREALLWNSENESCR